MSKSMVNAIGQNLANSEIILKRTKSKVCQKMALFHLLNDELLASSIPKGATGVLSKSPSKLQYYKIRLGEVLRPYLKRSLSVPSES